MHISMSPTLAIPIVSRVYSSVVSHVHGQVFVGIALPRDAVNFVDEASTRDTDNGDARNGFRDPLFWL